MRFTWLTAALMISAGIAYAQEASVRGTVKDAATGKPVVGASVYDEESGEMTITDEQGAFTLPPSSGMRHLAVVDPSYQRGDATSDGSTAVTVSLAPLSVQGTEVVVDVEKEHVAAGEVALQRDEVMKIPGAHGDPLVAIKNLPGIANVSGFGPQQGLVIRGSSPADSRIFVDGFEIPLLYHLGGITSVMPGEMIDDIVYSPGGFGVEWGKASAGIVDVISRQGAKQLSGFADVSFINAEALLQGPIGDKGSFAGSVRRSYIDGVIALAVPSSSSLAFTALPRYYDYQFRADYKPTAHWKLNAFVLGSNDVFAISSDATNPDDPAASGQFSQDTYFTRATASATYDAPGVYNKLAISGLTQTQGFEVGSDRHLHVGTDTLTARDEAKIDLGHDVKLVGGGQAELVDFNVDVKLPRPPHEGDPNQPNFTDDPLVTTKQNGTASNLSAWSAAEYTPTAWLKTTAGVRVDDFRHNHATVVQPRAQARVKLSDQTSILGAYGLYTRPPDNQDENLQADLRPERAWQSSLGVENKLVPGLTLSTTAYYLDRSDLIVAKAARSTATMSDGSDTYENTGIGRSYGAEMMLQARFERFFGWVSYTYAVSERRDHPMDAWRKFDDDQTNNFIALGSYKLGERKQWQLGARFQYTTGKPYTSVIGATFLSDQNRYSPMYGVVNSERQPDAHQLDIRIDHYWTFESWKLSGYLDVSNVYMNAPIQAISYNENYTKQQNVYGLPILPSIGVRGEF